MEEIIDKAELKNRVIEVLKSCYDPEIPVNIYELGLIYAIDIDDENNVKIKMTLTSPACPVAGSLPPEVENRVRKIPDVKSCAAEVVWEPIWGIHMMSEEARLQLGLY
jgi:FeS assembly SUF system protein